MNDGDRRVHAAAAAGSATPLTAGKGASHSSPRKDSRPATSGVPSAPAVSGVAVLGDRGVRT